MKWVMRDRRLKSALIRVADVQPGMRVLDVGCGTGTLAIMLHRAEPEALLTGIDPDPSILRIARDKAGELPIQWDQGVASELPYPDAAFDRVVSSLVIHHLDTDDKRAAFREACRVLGPDGQLVVLDFAPPMSLWERLVAQGMRRLESVADNYDGLLPTFMSEAGFSEVRESARLASPFGPVAIWRSSAHS